MKLPRSISFRLALTYMMLFTLSVIILMLFIYWSTAANMVRESDDLVETEINELVDHYDMLGLDGLKSMINERLSLQQAGLSIYLLTAQNYHPLAGNLDTWPIATLDTHGWSNFKLLSNEKGIPGKYEVRARSFTLPGGYHLLVGRLISHLLDLQQRIIITMAWGLALMLVAGGLVGWWLSRRMAYRIETINQTSLDIMNGDLTRRIPLSGSDDELDRLAAGLNEMLDRIQALMEDVKRVSDNIAHDLRTPLGRLRNQLDNLYSELKQSGHDTSNVEQAVNESEGLLTTFNALLRIARIEARSRSEGFTHVDFSSLVHDVAEFYEPLADARQQTLEVKAASGVHFAGDRDLLFQAMANLVDNAIKYTPEGGKIMLCLTPSVLKISDTGAGIPAEARQHIYQRFYRLETSRTTPGSGLGLSLVNAVARLHDIVISISDNSPGTCFSLALPLPAENLTAE